jgi:glycosyltransferase involved in cell wall biosynthesis
MHPSNPQNRAYLHFGGSTGFPISPAFFGQTFVMGNLTSVSRRATPGCKNITFVNKNRHDPLTDNLIGDGAKNLAGERFNTELCVGYGLDRMDEMVKTVRGIVDGGRFPVLVFHYPLCDAAYAERLGDALSGAGLRDSASIVYYLHTMVDKNIFKMNGGSFRSKHVSMFKAVDGTIAVSEAARASYLSVNVVSEGKTHSLDPDASYVVKNGIDTAIYAMFSKDVIDEAKDSIGLRPDLETVISFVGRLDRIKGSDFLVEVLRHYEESKDPDDSSVGFVIGTSSILRPDAASSPLKNLFKMKRLIAQGRLRVVVDISKFSRGDNSFQRTIENILLEYARPHGFGDVERHPAYGGMTTMPVQALSDIYLHPARSEGLPLSVVEAMFSTAFVIASRVGGIPEVVTHECMGRLIDMPEVISNGGQVMPQVYANAMKGFVASLIAEIKSYQAYPAKYYSFSAVQKTVESYMGITMFKGFENAVTSIMARRDQHD